MKTFSNKRGPISSTASYLFVYCNKFIHLTDSLRDVNVSELFILSFFGVTKNESQPGYFDIQVTFLISRLLSSSRFYYILRTASTRYVLLLRTASTMYYVLLLLRDCTPIVQWLRAYYYCVQIVRYYTITNDNLSKYPSLFLPTMPHLHVRLHTTNNKSSCMGYRSECEAP